MTDTSSHPPVDRLPRLGCIADDVTGATDLASNLVNGGFRVVQILGVPDSEMLSSLKDVDAVVVALKIRSVPPTDAVDNARDALQALQQLGIERFYYKYCSTFDSTDRGNIGPVTEALMGALGIDQTIFCPAFPRAGRTVYQGHLFVGERLLNESGMENHPINPMRDPNLLRCLSKQTRRTVGLLPHRVVCDGASAVQQHLRRLRDDGTALVVTDTCRDQDLCTIAEAVASMPLLTGGSGLGRYLPQFYRPTADLRPNGTTWSLPKFDGRSGVIAGSCSEATLAQVRQMSQSCPTWHLDVSSVMTGADQAFQQLVEWARGQPSSCTLLIASTEPPGEVRSTQDRFGAENVARSVERFLSDAAHMLVNDLRVRKLVLAGGETSGAILNRLGVRSLRIGSEICPGVPWTETIGTTPPLALALKSGNFGDADFFEAALGMLP